jgi:hypothetical protein
MSVRCSLSDRGIARELCDASDWIIARVERHSPVRLRRTVEVVADLGLPLSDLR